MKTFLLTLVFTAVLCGGANAQANKKILLDKNISGLHLLYTKTTNADMSDTYLLQLSFQNNDNPKQTDIRSISITSDDIAMQFTKDLNNAITQMDSGEDVEMSWDRKNYSISVGEKAKGLQLYAENRVASFWLAKKNADKLWKLINEVSFGTDAIGAE